MADVVVAFLIVRDGANNVALCDGLCMASMHDIRPFGGR